MPEPVVRGRRRPCAATTTGTPFSGAACAVPARDRLLPALPKVGRRAARRSPALAGSSCCRRAPSAVGDAARCCADRSGCAGCRPRARRPARGRAASARRACAPTSAAAKWPGCPGCTLRVARLLQQQRQPADLELGAGADQQVGVARARDQARPGLDLVRVLQRGGGDRHVDLVAAELLRERAPFGLAGEHAQRGVRRQREQQRAAPRRSGSRAIFIMRSPVNSRARRGRPGSSGTAAKSWLSVAPSRARSRANCSAHARELARAVVEHQRCSCVGW